MDKINIRRASADDFEAISSIVLDSFVSEIHGNIKELEDTNITDYNKFCEFYCSRSEANIPFVIYIAEVNDKIIGAASGAVDEHHWGSEKWGSEDFWFVKKEYRGSKAGLLLFDKLMNWFKENNAKRIHMTHYTWNPTIKDFYEKRGFKPFEVSYVYKVGK